MKYRKFGNTSMMVSEIGFGAWAIGGAAKVGKMAIGWGPADDVTSIQALNSAKEAGINFFDTADFYGIGHSEELIGNTFGNDASIYIATKVGQKIGTQQNIEIDYSKQYVLNACEASLKRLKRDCIDYYQLHVANINHLQQGDCLEAMQILQQQGKIKYWGISLFTFNPFTEAAFIMNNNLAHGFQLVFNIINQKAFPLLQQMQQKGYGVIARMPLQFGLLTGKFNSNTVFDEMDHRSFRLTPNIIETANEMLKPVFALCTKYKCSKVQLALSFVAAFTEISTTIPGIRTADQATANANAIIELEEVDKFFLQQLYKTQFEDFLTTLQQQG